MGLGWNENFHLYGLFFDFLTIKMSYNYHHGDFSVLLLSMDYNYYKIYILRLYNHLLKWKKIRL